MDEGLSREEKRRLKKKERKKKQRQGLAVQKLQMIETNSDSELHNDEMQSVEVSSSVSNPITKTQEKQLIPKAICEQCKESKVKYFCKECSKYYCENVFFSQS